MGTALSLILFAVGAVLTFAVRDEPSGLDITTVGVIIMLVSAVQFVWTVYREQWRRRVVEESIEQGNGVPPMPLDDTVLVDPSAPFEAPAHLDIVQESDVHHTVPERSGVHIDVEPREHHR